MNFHEGPLAFEGDSPLDPEQFRAAGQHDAARDRQWFLDHPEETERPRLVTFDEALQADVPMGTAVRVMQLPDGTQVRAIQSPQ